jgi:hypothetical protein
VTNGKISFKILVDGSRQITHISWDSEIANYFNGMLQFIQSMKLKLQKDVISYKISYILSSI